MSQSRLGALPQRENVNCLQTSKLAHQAVQVSMRET